MQASGYDYDLVVIGSGPAGQRAAIQAAKLDKKVAIIEKTTVVGGVSVNLGTIPSKTLREAALDLSGFRSREFYGASYTVKENITIQDLLVRTNQVISHGIDIARHQLMRNHVELISANASFTDPHTLKLDLVDGRTSRLITAGNIVIATGTETTRDKHVPFDGTRIFTSDDILHLDELPRSIAVVGAGVIGCEYASILAALGVRVTLIDARHRLLSFVDAELADELAHHLREKRVTIRLGESVKQLEVIPTETGERVRLSLDSGKTIVTEKALYSVGRTGATSKLDLEAAGIKPDTRGRLTVDENFRTAVPHIYAAGDVIGFPALASTSMEQGRVAVCHAFDFKYKQRMPSMLPMGICTIPEISTAGETEESCKEKKIDYCVGRALYANNARGHITGDTSGMLKLIFARADKKLLGVSITGESATELIHIGMMALDHNLTIDEFIEQVFNYPTLSETYKYAAYEGLGNLAGHKVREG